GPVRRDVDLPIQHRAVELRESAWIGTVDDDAREACDSHAGHSTRDSGRCTSGYPWRFAGDEIGDETPTRLAPYGKNPARGRSRFGTSWSLPWRSRSGLLIEQGRADHYDSEQRHSHDVHGSTPQADTVTLEQLTPR